MPNYTTNLHLEKPLSNEFYSIDKINSNTDIIDESVGARTKYTDLMSLEEIEAASSLSNKIASADAAKSLDDKKQNAIISEYFTSTTDAWGNVPVPQSMIRPSIGRLLCAEVANQFVIVQASTEYDAYILRIKYNDQDMSNVVSQQITVFVSYVK